MERHTLNAEQPVVQNIVGEPTITPPGQYNKLPEGWEPMSIEEFSRSWWFIYRPTGFEFRQVILALEPDGKEVYRNLYMYWFHNTGICMISDYWAEKIYFFRFGCRHNFKTVPRDEWEGMGIHTKSRHWNVQKCSKCGEIQEFDSSG